MPPHVGGIDSTIALGLEGYRFISSRCRSAGADSFSCRLLFRKAVCISGPGAAELFYDTSCFRRHGVAPRRIRKTLLGDGGVHGLDAAAHRHRKAMFLSVLGPQCLEPLRRRLQDVWMHAGASWSGRTIDLFAEARRRLFRAVTGFAGVPFAEAEVESRSSDLMAMVDAFGAVGPRHWRGRLARRRSERWIADIIEQTRRGTLAAAPGSALAVISTHRDLDGELLDQHTAAVELLNVIRPMMAAVYLLELAAAALSARPDLRPRVIQDDNALTRFVHEVRRFYPFTPFLGAEACRDVRWQGFVIPEGTLTLLDVYGIQHDDRIWPGADVFDPDRFKSWNGSPFTLLQQGGGDHATGHRCAGEWMTIEALKAGSRALGSIDYTTNCESLLFDLRRIPARLAKPLEFRVR